MQVLPKVIILPIGGACSWIVSSEANRAVAFIVEIPQNILLCAGCRESLLCNRRTLDYVVLRIAAVIIRFARPDAISVILVVVGLTTNGCAGKLPLGATGGLDLRHQGGHNSA